ncbi:hypothetical protein BACI349Y_310039 [Bacillus sp. 349Y]|nr:hypothetical protein BACI349Y_310039 [Bacillus sp. 349Y]
MRSFLALENTLLPITVLFGLDKIINKEVFHDGFYSTEGTAPNGLAGGAPVRFLGNRQPVSALGTEQRGRDPAVCG